MSLRWYFDFISPFAYLQWRRLAPMRASLQIEAVPILFAAVLDHHGHKGPAEIPGKREFTYRFVNFEAARRGIALRFPSAHPFNPLPALRLAVALDARHDVIDAIFEQIWAEGASTDDFAALARRFGLDDVQAATATSEVKARLRTHTEAAIERGLFGVPTLAVGDELFWGDDATAMALACVEDPDFFARGEYARIHTLPEAVKRKGAG